MLIQYALLTPSNMKRFTKLTQLFFSKISNSAFSNVLCVWLFCHPWAEFHC